MLSLITVAERFSYFAHRSLDANFLLLEHGEGGAGDDVVFREVDEATATIGGRYTFVTL